MIHVPDWLEALAKGCSRSRLGRRPIDLGTGRFTYTQPTCAGGYPIEAQRAYNSGDGRARPRDGTMGTYDTFLT